MQRTAVCVVKDIVLILAGIIAQITQITPPYGSLNRISQSFELLILSLPLLIAGTDVRGRGVTMEMCITVAFQEDGSWQHEAEHRQQLIIGRVKDSILRFKSPSRTMTLMTFQGL